MDTLWSIIIVFGLVSLLLLVCGVWTQCNQNRKERENAEHKNSHTEPK